VASSQSELQHLYKVPILTIDDSENGERAQRCFPGHGPRNGIIWLVFARFSACFAAGAFDA
jgi:hypothetical protein